MTRQTEKFEVIGQKVKISRGFQQWLAILLYIARSFLDLYQNYLTFLYLISIFSIQPDFTSKGTSSATVTHCCCVIIWQTSRTTGLHFWTLTIWHSSLGMVLVSKLQTVSIVSSQTFRWMGWHFSFWTVSQDNWSSQLE